MSSQLSMTTNKPKKKKSKSIWRIKTTESGDMRLIPIKEEKQEQTQGGTILATMPSKLIQNNQVDNVIDKITNLGGIVSFVKGRRIGIHVEGNDIETVGDFLDSCGCQWDVE